MTVNRPLLNGIKFYGLLALREVWWGVSDAHVWVRIPFQDCYCDRISLEFLDLHSLKLIHFNFLALSNFKKVFKWTLHF